ncbi:MAG: helix-turn-helix domain-containing protein [Prevotellaceae bacterium]|jgi:y4mF family transcriptional regulator|nr:helix-turn-helix domain-containing protein [Prevotellaceae bacterium]
MSVEQIGNTIKNRRKELKITQPYLAELAEVSVNTLYKIERGQSNPSLAVLEKLADVLGLEITLQVRKIE